MFNLSTIVLLGLPKNTEENYWLFWIQLLVIKERWLWKSKLKSSTSKTNYSFTKISKYFTHFNTNYSLTKYFRSVCVTMQKCTANFSRKCSSKTGSFPFVPPRLVGAYYLHLLEARAILLHNDLLCNGTCSVTGGGGGGA